MTAFDYQKQVNLVDDQYIKVYFADSDNQTHTDQLCVFVAALPRLSGFVPDTIPDLTDLAPTHPIPGSHYLVAQVNNQVVGAIAVLCDQLVCRYGYHMAHVAQFRIDVLPTWQEKGVEQSLVGGLIEWAQGQDDLRRLESKIVAFDQSIIDLLESYGFEIEGRARAAWHVRTTNGNFDLDIVSLALLVDNTHALLYAAQSETEPAPDLTIPDIDCAPFFTELVEQVRAFLPYELREFETYQTANEVHLLIEGLLKDVSFALAFRLASDAYRTPDMIEMGLHFRRDSSSNQAQVEQFAPKLDALGEAIGRKTLYADVWHRGWGRVAVRLPYQLPQEVHTFMLAAQIAGFITVLSPEIAR